MPLESLKREKDDAREVREGFECGIKLAGFNDVKEGDILEAYRSRRSPARFRPAAVPAASPVSMACRACQTVPGDQPRSRQEGVPMSSRRTQKAAEAIREVVSMAILTDLKIRACRM